MLAGVVHSQFPSDGGQVRPGDGRERLRDKFFAQHVARFHKRPFIWHVWDGHKEGFAALLNVHTLTRAKLQTLIHTYLATGSPSSGARWMPAMAMPRCVWPALRP